MSVKVTRWAATPSLAHQVLYFRPLASTTTLTPGGTTTMAYPATAELWEIESDGPGSVSFDSPGGARVYSFYNARTIYLEVEGKASGNFITGVT